MNSISEDNRIIKSIVNIFPEVAQIDENFYNTDINYCGIMWRLYDTVVENLKNTNKIKEVFILVEEMLTLSTNDLRNEMISCFLENLVFFSIRNPESEQYLFNLACINTKALWLEIKNPD